MVWETVGLSKEKGEKITCAECISKRVRPGQGKGCINKVYKELFF
jgi:hypothetical protein